MRTGLILMAMDSQRRPLPLDPEHPDDLAHTTRWIPLVIPVAGALILAITLLVWIAVLG